ncbi:UrcA family protein [Sphingomonas immobilis]|uniref:UrcA family protein n=1 Tax=Sphingomonas immobilis TaxID=3063997 RepID=A0ABT8ZV89_9SPHN|nr:UrcA family protein [Sphingomonas sp. CA1-15]MDO7841493.1 UrcA family protein [Sphingomonas sp. CA1-15]
MTLRTLATLALAAATLTAAPAFAAPQEGAATVRYADLDLSTAAGVATLHRRVGAALETVCGSYAGATSSAWSAEADAIKQCRADARSKADQQVAAIVAAKVQVAAR